MKTKKLMIFLALLLTIILTFLVGCCCPTCGPTIYYSPSGKQFPTSWGSPPEVQTKDYRPLQEGYGHGSSTLYHWIEENQK